MNYKTVQVTFVCTYGICWDDSRELYGRELDELDIARVQEVDGSISSKELLHLADDVELTFKFLEE